MSTDSGAASCGPGADLPRQVVRLEPRGKDVRMQNGSDTTHPFGLTRSEQSSAMLQWRRSGLCRIARLFFSRSSLILEGLEIEKAVNHFLYYRVIWDFLGAMSSTPSRNPPQT